MTGIWCKRSHCTVTPVVQRVSSVHSHYAAVHVCHALAFVATTAATVAVTAAGASVSVQEQQLQCVASLTRDACFDFSYKHSRILSQPDT
jgi:hypothetical protein